MGSIAEWFSVIFLSVLPVSELRGAIPVGVAMGLDPLIVFVVAVTFNALAFVPVYYGLELFYGYFSRYDWFRERIERIGSKRGGVIERYGVIGHIVFVAVPLPVTGAWTGTLLAWLFKLDFKRAWATVALGVLISGTIVISLTMLGIEMISIL